MNAFLPFVVAGLASGAVYGMAGMGLVLTYKTSGILNLGYGAVAALASFLFYLLHTEHHLAWPIAAVICIFLAAPAFALALELVARSLSAANETTKVVATVGLILIVEAVGALWHPQSPVPTFPYFLSQSTVKILGVYITWDQIIIFVFSLVMAGVLFIFFRSTRLGIVMKGVVDNPELISMVGDNPISVRRWAWIIGTMFSSAAGIMLASALPLDGVSLTTAVFASFGAAAIGYFSNLPLTFVGGLCVGIGEALLSKYAATSAWIGGLAPSLPFIVLFAVLIVTPKDRLVQRQMVARTALRRAYQAPIRVRIASGAVAIALLAIMPSVQGSYLAVWSTALIDMILFLSLGFLVRRSGQISLCQIAFAAIGASTFSHLVSFHIPWLPSLVLTALVAVPIGAILAIPAIRVSGTFLALATLGFGFLAQGVFYTRNFMFGSSPLGVSDPRPNLSIGSWNLSSDIGFYYVILLILVITVILYAAMGNGRLGRLTEAMADSPLALETNGAALPLLKVIVFCISAATASVAGALTGMLYHYVTPTSFDPFTSLTLVALVVIITVGEPWYALIAAIGYAVIPGYISAQTTLNVLTLIFGISAVFAIYGARAAGMPAALAKFLDRIGGRVVARTAMSDHDSKEISTTAENGTSDRDATRGRDHDGSTNRLTGLEVHDLSVRFGGVKAVNTVTLAASPGYITGLIGPNGAGKTTLFNACSGLNRPSSGDIRIHGLGVAHKGPAARARLGLGRTFQRTELMNSLSVRTNVAMGAEASLAGRNPLTHIFGSRRSDRQVLNTTDDAIDVTGIRGIADMQVGLLPIGLRRLVELARVLAGPFDVLLMDEPSSGLDQRESEAFGGILQTVVDQRECAILLVEHDMRLIRMVCDYVYVLDFGEMIFEGTPAEMNNSDSIRAAYLGSEVDEGSAASSNVDGD